MLRLDKSHQVAATYEHEYQAAAARAKLVAAGLRAEIEERNSARFGSYSGEDTGKYLVVVPRHAVARAKFILGKL